MDLRDKIVLVTGAGSGIGRATAIACARHGARVIACSLHEHKLDSLRDQLGDRALLVKGVDVAQRGEMRAFAERVHGLVPAVDVLINNAGVAVGGSFVDTSLDDWDWLLATNLYGVIYGCHYFVPAMIRRGRGGQVVNLSSIFGIYPAPHSIAYVTSKFAVRGFSMSLRSELARHDIGVTALCPGLVDTGIIAHGRMVGEAGSRKGLLADLFRRGASPERVANAILDAIRDNPAVAMVGVDAHLLSALTRVMPNVVDRVGSSVSRVLGFDGRLRASRERPVHHGEPAQRLASEQARAEPR